MARGAAIGIGLLDPGEAYYHNVADGDGEARLLRAQMTAARGQSGG